MADDATADFKDFSLVLRHAMPSAETNRTPEEFARIGTDVYERQVKPLLRAEDDGKYVAVDVRTGAYEVNDDDYLAVMQLQARIADADIWLARAGEPATYRMRRIR
jgi:hypothetical protein